MDRTSGAAFGFTIDAHTKPLTVPRMRVKRTYKPRPVVPGKCSVCGKRASKGKRLCRSHLDKAASRSWRWQLKRRCEGKCTVCGEPVHEGKKLCLKHLEINAHRSKEKYYQRKAVALAA